MKKKNEKRLALIAKKNETLRQLVRNPSELYDFLKLQTRFDRYSISNALLIYAQNSRAVKLKTFDDWNAQNISIKRGAKSIDILEPIQYTRKDGTTGTAYNVKKLFDVSQTTCTEKTGENGKYDSDPNEITAITAALLDSSGLSFKVINESTPPEIINEAQKRTVYYSNSDKCLYLNRGTGQPALVCQATAQALAYAELCKQKCANDFIASCIAVMLCTKFNVESNTLFKHIFILPDKDNVSEDDTDKMQSDLLKIKKAYRAIYTQVEPHIKRQESKINKEKTVVKEL